MDDELLLPVGSEPAWPFRHDGPSRRSGVRCHGECRVREMVWQLIADSGARYHDLGADWYERRADPERGTRERVRHLERLGNTVTLTPSPSVLTECLVPGSTINTPGTEQAISPPSGPVILRPKAPPIRLSPHDSASPASTPLCSGNAPTTRPAPRLPPPPTPGREAAAPPPRRRCPMSRAPHDPVTLRSTSPAPLSTGHNPSSHTPGSPRRTGRPASPETGKTPGQSPPCTPTSPPPSVTMSAAKSVSGAAHQADSPPMAGSEPVATACCQVRTT